jgi:hypothetical protein
LQAQIAKSAEAYQDLKRDRDKVLDDVAALKTTVEEVTRARADADARVVDLSQQLRRVRENKAQDIVRSIGAALPPLVIAAAVATLSFWTYQLIWSPPRPPLAVTGEPTPEAEQQRLAAIKEEEKAKAAEVEAKLNAAETEQQRLKEEVQLQTKATADAEAKRKAAEAGQQPLQDEVQRQANARADAEAKRKAAEAEQQRLAALLKADQERREKAEAEAAKAKGATGLFTIRTNTEATGPPELALSNVLSTAACEEVCKREPSCDIFSYDKRNGICRRYTRSVLLDFKSNEKFDSGVRIEQTNPSLDIKVAAPASPVMSVSPTGPFTLRTNTEATGYPPEYSSWYAASIATCEERCTREPRCKIFSYNKISGMCFRYAKADFKSNEKFDTGVRIEQPK